MGTFNRVYLLGHLGGDPELVEGKSGRIYTRLRLATDRIYSTKEGERVEKTDWHSVFVFGPQAERCAQYLRKGSAVFVEGHITSWQSEGEKIARTGIHAYDVQFVDRKPAVGLDNMEASRNHDAVAHPVMM